MKKKTVLIIKWICANIIPGWYIKRRFIAHHNYVPDFKNPQTFSEKIAKRKFNYTKEMSRLSDKVAVRDYVKEMIGEKYLIPAYAITDKLTRDVFDKLPSSFVIKANHGSRYNCIVRNKSEYTFEDLKAITDKWLKDKYYLTGMELHYRHIKPRLIAEKLLLDEEGNVPRDFKVHVFKNEGKIKVFTGVHSARFTNFNNNYYDENWELVKNPWVGEAEINWDYVIERPKKFDELLRLAKKLSSSYSYLRIDFYIVDDQIYFGELTFTPGGGSMQFERREIDKYVGRLWGDQKNLSHNIS